MGRGHSQGGNIKRVRRVLAEGCCGCAPVWTESPCLPAVERSHPCEQRSLQRLHTPSAPSPRLSPSAHRHPYHSSGNARCSWGIRKVLLGEPFQGGTFNIQCQYGRRSCTRLQPDRLNRAEILYGCAHSYTVLHNRYTVCARCMTHTSDTHTS